MLEEGRLSGGQFLIDMNTIRSTDGKYNETLVNHLKGGDFFEVESYPNAKFQIIKFLPKSKTTYEIHEDLTIKHIKNPIVLKRMSLKLMINL